MPRSVYSSTGHGKLSRLNPIKLVTRFVAIAMVASIALLATPQLAGALTTTTVSAVSFTPAAAHVRAGETSTWTVVYTTASVLADNDVVNVTFPTGTTFASPAATATGGNAGTATVAVSGTTLNITLTAGIYGAGASTLVITNVKNPAASDYAVSATTVAVNSGTAQSATAGVNIFEAALAAPTVTQAGNGLATLSYTTDGSPSSVTTTYTPSATPNSGVTVCAAYTNADVSGTPSTQTCAISGLTIGTSYTFNVAETGGTDPISGAGAASSAFIASTALKAPSAARNGSGTATITVTGDGVATTYTVVATPGGASCVYANLTPLALNTTATCSITGLTNGTSYTFVVTPSGNSTTSTASSASTALIPGAALATPTAINAGTSSSVIFFTADGVATTYTITGVTHNTDTCVVTVSTPLTGAQSCLDTAAVAEAGGYTVTPSGNSTSSTISAASNATVQTAVLGASTTGAPSSALAGAGAVKVTWLADGVASQYTVNLVDTTSGARDQTKTLGAGGSTAVAAGTQSVTFTGLTTGDVVNFNVLASGNATGLTTVSATTTNNLVVSAALATPTVATAGTGAILVSFTADGVAATYTVTSTGGSAGAFTCTVANTTTVPTGAQSCTVTGLASGTAYTFTVTPSNGGTSTISNSSASITTVSALNTPTIGSAPSGAVVVNFTADGTASTYTVTSTPGGFTCTVVNTTTAPTGAQSCTVTGLTNGTSYTFTVAPSGNADSTVVSLKSAAAVAGSALATPTVALAGHAAITVSFVADGVSSTYTVQSNLALTPFTAETKCVVANTSTAPTGAQSCKVTGLTDGTSYTFTVTPSGNSTTSTVSAASASLAPSAALATPTVANAGTGAITVSFVADGVASSYTVISTGGSLTCTVINTVTAPTGAQHCTVTGLTNGTSYTFQVETPTGNSTTSTASAQSASIEVGVNFLAAPTAAFAASGSALVSFTADGVASTYTVTSTPGGFTCTVINSTTPPTGAQSCPVSGLTNGTSYTFHVVPSGNGTTSLKSAESASFVAAAGVAPAAPTAVTATAGQGSIVVTWVAPTNTGGSAITSYVVTGTAGTVTTSCGTVDPTATTCTLSGLADATSYSVSVQAVNAIGTSPAGTATATTLAALTAPGAPTGVTAVGGTQSIVVTWVAPTTTGGSAITGYSVTGVAGANTVSCGTVDPTATTCTLSGLSDGTAYAVSVEAVNAVGSSTAGTATATTSAALTAPGAPTGVTATGGQNSIAVSWTAPTSTGGSAITGYVVTGTAGIQTTSCGALSASATSCILLGLANSAPYSVSVVAVNTIGSSAPGTATATTLPGKVVVKVFKVTGVHGTAFAGRTVTVTISGVGFFGAPRITSSVAGTTAKVVKDNGRLLTVHVTVRAGTPHGVGVFTVRLANGKTGKVRYSHA
jgi:hypothetical protein